MGKICAVPGCDSGIGKTIKQRKSLQLRRVSLFSVPKNQDRRRRWKNALSCELDINQFVCEFHFSDDVLKKCERTVMPDGSIHEWPLLRWRLEQNAVPKSEQGVPMDCKDMQQLLAFGRIWTTFRTARDVGARCPGILFPRTRESSCRSFRTRMSSVLENRLKARDLIPESFVLVYRGGMDGYIHLAYATSTLIFISSVISLYSVFDADKPISFPMNMWSDRLVGLQNYTQLFIVYAALFAMILSLGSISRKYVLRMYYNDKTQTYRVVRVGFLPTAIRTHDFEAGSLQRINKRSVVPWLNVQYKHNGEKYLILDEGFRTNADYERMFRDGYA